ncbi:MAG TPA: RDD family protein [Caulobacteraceae bacterium]|nr:RDD family protein [Caulobacteraceae bacterium]
MVPTTAAVPAEPFVRRFITPEGIDLRLTLGSGGERAAAFLIDAAIMAASLVVLTLVIGVLAASVGLENAEPWGIVWLLGFFILRNGYFILFELTARAATPGKRALGLRVAARDGGRLTGEAVFVRNAMREIEIFLPAVFVLAGNAAGDPVDAWLVLLGCLWTGGLLFFPLFNRDRLRVGDFVAGTWVVKAPRRSLRIDLAERQDGAFSFSRQHLAAYGVKELQVLEGVLRAADARTMAAVAERIRGKIGWYRAEHETDAAFLTAYYGALRGRLEQRLLFGHRRRDKFDKA